MTWEQAVEWARQAPEMSGLVEGCYYDDPIEVAARRFKESNEWAAIKSLLNFRQGARVLEIGAGRGIVSWAFASEGCNVQALEPNPSLLVGTGAIRRLCDVTKQSIMIAEELGEQICFPENSFEYVICRQVLHHVDDLKQVCREVYRVLKPGGRFLAIQEHVADNRDELEAFLKIHPLHHLYGGEHAFPLIEYLGGLREAGFKRILNFGHFDHPISGASEEYIRCIAERALKSRLGPWISSRLAQNEVVIYAYRRWLTFRKKIPGRLHSFLAEKSK